MVIERILKSHKTQLQNPVCSLKHTVMEDDAETSKPFLLQQMTNNQINVSGHDTTECQLPKLKPNAMGCTAVAICLQVTFLHRISHNHLLFIRQLDFTLLTI